MVSLLPFSFFCPFSMKISLFNWINYIFCRLDENPFCLKAEAARICNNSRPLRSFIPLEDCAPLPCFSDPIFLSDCRRPYLGSLFFRSFSFSDLTNSLYYAFLTESLQPRLEKLQIPIDRVCLVSSMIDLNGYLVLNISFLPPDGYSFNRTGVSTINNYLNNHIYPSPYGPYYYSDLSYTNFPGKRDDALLRTSSVCIPFLLSCSSGWNCRTGKKYWPYCWNINSWLCACVANNRCCGLWLSSKEDSSASC